MNPTFELTYWRWGLETAQRWRERLELGRDQKWDQVLSGLARPSLADGKYLFAETAPQSYSDRKWVKDHPSVLAALGILPAVRTAEGTPLARAGADAADAGLDLGELELAGYVGLGLSDGRNDRGTAGRARASD